MKDLKGVIRDKKTYEMIPLNRKSKYIKKRVDGNNDRAIDHAILKLNDSIKDYKSKLEHYQPDRALEEDKRSPWLLGLEGQRDELQAILHPRVQASIALHDQQRSARANKEASAAACFICSSPAHRQRDCPEPQARGGGARGAVARAGRQGRVIAGSGRCNGAGHGASVAVGGHNISGARSEYSGGRGGANNAGRQGGGGKHGNTAINTTTLNGNNLSGRRGHRDGGGGNVHNGASKDVYKGMVPLREPPLRNDTTTPLADAEGVVEYAATPATLATVATIRETTPTVGLLRLTTTSSLPVTVALPLAAMIPGVVATRAVVAETVATRTPLLL